MNAIQREPAVVTDTYWNATAPSFRAPSLKRSTTTDVCIVGGGIAGLSVAYQLSKAGISVAVLDAGKTGSGETGLTTAHLVTALDRRYENLLRVHGEERTRLIAASHRAAIDAIERTVRDESISCDFEYCDGYLLGAGDDGSRIIDAEHAAADKAGEPTALVDCPTFARWSEGPCLRFSRQGKFHPLKYLNGVVAAIKRNGGRIYHNSRAYDIEGGPDAHVTTESGATVRAKFVVVATNTPVNDRFTLHTRIAAYRSYVVGLAILVDDSFPDLVWDTDEPFHFVRCHRASPRGGIVLIVGGEDHKTGQADPPEAKRFDRLEQWARARFPAAKQRRFAWSGQIMETLDGIAYIGRNPGDQDNVFVVTGDCGDGMTHGTIAGLLLSDLICGRDNPWAAVYDPSRTRPAGSLEFIKENVNVAAQYADWLGGGDVADVRDIPADSGAIIRRGLAKVAVYRDVRNQLHEMSAACPHLGCVVAWNSAEKSWDCPCHGSRFSSTGDVLNGPALGGLSPIESKNDAK
jgi:glycine/D-amino acid oxidase-like deaminating enzyme/nitrite reductase/ring-hydroxylating ferredoxin subunit